MADLFGSIFTPGVGNGLRPRPQSYDDMQGKEQRAHEGSQSEHPAKQDIP